MQEYLNVAVNDNKFTRFYYYINCTMFEENSNCTFKLHNYIKSSVNIFLFRNWLTELRLHFQQCYQLMTPYITRLLAHSTHTFRWGRRFWKSVYRFLRPNVAHDSVGLTRNVEGPSVTIIIFEELHQQNYRFNCII